MDEGIQQIKEIYPVGTELKFGNDMITIKSIPIGDIDEIGELLVDLVDKTKEVAKNKKDGGFITKLLVDAMKDNKQGVFRLIHSSTGLDVKEIEKYSVEAFMVLLKMVVKENLDFFTMNVAPQLSSLMELMSEAKATDPMKTAEDGVKPSKP